MESLIISESCSIYSGIFHKNELGNAYLYWTIFLAEGNIGIYCFIDSLFFYRKIAFENGKGKVM